MISSKKFIKKIAEENKITASEAAFVYNAFITTLQKALYEEGEDVWFRKFGAFKHCTIPERKFKLPRYSEPMTAPEINVVKFKEARSTKLKGR